MPDYKSAFPWPVHLIGMLKRWINLNILIVFCLFFSNVKTIGYQSYTFHCKSNFTLVIAVEVLVSCFFRHLRHWS